MRQVPISSVADVTYGTTYGGIKRKDAEARHHHQLQRAQAASPVPTWCANIQTALKAFPAPRRLHHQAWAAPQENQKETSDFLPLAGLGWRMGLIFLILVTQFNSFSKPLIILSEVHFLDCRRAAWAWPSRA
ncbi:MAG: hypothetical protein WKG07_19320 [Hymenobacter sp.]